MMLKALRAADETGLDAMSLLATVAHSFEQRRLLLSQAGTRFGTADTQDVATRIQAHMRDSGHVVAIQKPRSSRNAPDRLSAQSDAHVADSRPAPRVALVTDESNFDVDGQMLARSVQDLAAAEQELSDRVWYDRSLGYESDLDTEGLAELRRVAGPGRRQVEATYGVENLGAYDDFQWAMLNGKLSAIRWALGYEWDFLHT